LRLVDIVEVLITTFDQNFFFKNKKCSIFFASCNKLEQMLELKVITIIAMNFVTLKSDSDVRRSVVLSPSL